MNYKPALQTLIVAIAYFFGNAFCFTQSNIKMNNYKASYTTFDVSNGKFRTASFNMPNGMKVEISPIDPVVLGESIGLEAKYDGRLSMQQSAEKSKEVVLKRIKKTKWQNKSDQEILVELLDSLMSRSKISENDYGVLFAEIAEKYNGLSGITESGVISDFRTNPFYISGRFCNVFKITLTNNSEKSLFFPDSLYFTLNNNSIQHISGQLLMSYLQEEKRLNSDMIDYLNEYYLSTVTYIPPRETVEKYFAISPFDMDSVSLNVYNISNGETQSGRIDFTKHYETYFESISYYVLDLDIVSSSGLSIKTASTLEGISALLTPESNCFLNEYELYVPADEMEKEITIYGLYVYADDVYYGSVSFVPKDKLNFAKNTSTMVDLELKRFPNIKTRRPNYNN